MLRAGVKSLHCALNSFFSACTEFGERAVNNCSVSLFFFLTYKLGTIDFCALRENAMSCVSPVKLQLETYIQAVYWLKWKL